MITFNLLTALQNKHVLHFLDEETDARGENTIRIRQLVHKGNTDLSSDSKDSSFYNINSLRQKKKTLRILNAI